jgi:hypothetical protein
MESSRNPISDSHESAADQSVADAIMTMFKLLSRNGQERLLRALTDTARPIPVHKGGEVLDTVVRLFPVGEPVTVSEISDKVKAEGIEASPREIWNALGYLKRKGHVRRIGYGRYLVDGVGVDTLDNLGAPPRDRNDLSR